MRKCYRDPNFQFRQIHKSSWTVNGVKVLWKVEGYIYEQNLSESRGIGSMENHIVVVKNARMKNLNPSNNIY